jgi:transketolase
MTLAQHTGTRQAIDTVRTLAMDAVQQTGTGHPGTAMALAPAAFVLWTRFLSFDPADPTWVNRDRFVLSNGHAAVLQYAVLHLTGYDLPLAELRRLRQMGSRTPGHPEYGHTAGVEATTGPLGQGLATGVGMAMAERFLAGRYNAPGRPLVDHRVWVFAGDGDLQEGITSEASSLAGHLGLGKLTVLYDDNRITIDGSTGLSFSEDVATRYAAYGWHVLGVPDVNGLGALTRAYQAAVDEPDRPTLIIARSEIGYGAPHLQGTAEAHGAPLGESEVRAAKQFYGWDPDAHFAVPEAAYHAWQQRVPANQAAHAAWTRLAARFGEDDPMAHEEFQRVVAGRLPAGIGDGLAGALAGAPAMPTRQLSGLALNAVAPHLPELVGGSADLTAATFTGIDGAATFTRAAPGRQIHFGVRENAMAAVANGLSLSHLRPFVSTFLAFTDYMRPSMRLAALMRRPVVYVLSHDSVGASGDGPTHQPVEHLAALRAMPNLAVIRPADGPEVAEAWRAALLRGDGPTAICLTRQPVPVLDRAALGNAAGLHRGAYVLADAAGGEPELVLIGTGSEVHVCLAARDRLTATGLAVRVVSMPCWELFAAQDPGYQDSVLPPSVRARVSVEAASSFGWIRWVGPHGRSVSLDRFGACAQHEEVLHKFGFHPDNVCAVARQVISGAS